MNVMQAFLPLGGLYRKTPPPSCQKFVLQVHRLFCSDLSSTNNSDSAAYFSTESLVKYCSRINRNEPREQTKMIETKKSIRMMLRAGDTPLERYHNPIEKECQTQCRRYLRSRNTK
jgi:hypothetical protein